MNTSLPSNALWLWDGPAPADAGDGFRPWLERYPAPAGQPRGAVLVCPGGGYGGRAPHEAEPIARRFNEAGLHGFVVHYRVAPHRHPAPLSDVARAIRLIREHAPEWSVDPARIAVCGFSAGGHLAASAGTLCPDEASRPDALILCYPVLSSGPYGHRGSFENLLGPDPSPEALRAVSLELQVTGRTPPAFMWHTADDAAVPVENSLLFAQALRAHRVPFELHVYPSGEHGLGLAPDRPRIATWSALCAGWLLEMGW
jgi:acetyl esterase/lipase